MMDIETLFDALIEAKTAVDTERAEREKGEGYDWGYFGAHYIDDRTNAIKRFGDALNEYIDQRIEAATGARP